MTMRKIVSIFVLMVVAIAPAVAQNYDYATADVVGLNFTNPPAWLTLLMGLSVVFSIACIVLVFKLLALCDRFADFKKLHEAQMSDIIRKLDAIAPSPKSAGNQVDNE